MYEYVYVYVYVYVYEYVYMCMYMYMCCGSEDTGIAQSHQAICNSQAMGAPRQNGVQVSVLSRRRGISEPNASLRMMRGREKTSETLKGRLD